MENKKKITMRIPPQALLDPVQLRVRQLQEEEERRFNEITDQIIDILIKENVLVREIPRLVSVVTNRINQKIDGSSVNSILKKL